jgi:hypothetical protein
MRRRRITGYWLPRWCPAVAESCCKPPAQRAAFPRLRRSHTCRCGRCLRGRSDIARVGDRSPATADASGFLSWGFKDAPPSVSTRCVRSRRAPSCDGPRLRPGRCHSPRRLPSLPFLPASTVCSAARLAGSAPSAGSGSSLTRSRGGVAPATDPGVHAVSAPAAMSAVSRSAWCLSAPGRKDRESTGRARRCVPGHALPFEAFPSSAAVPSSPTGDTFSPLQVAALIVVAVANRDDDPAGGCRPQGLAPLPSP